MLSELNPHIFRTKPRNKKSYAEKMPDIMCTSSETDYDHYIMTGKGIDLESVIIS